MKARYHILFGIILLGLLMFLDYNFNFIITKYLFLQVGIVTIIFGVGLYYLGLILPDSDIKDGKSRIFFSTFFIFGWINRLLEYPLAILLSRKIGHRESLHTIIGIFLSSVLFALMFSIIIYVLGKYGNYNSYTLAFLFFCVFFGQFMHLLCDWYWKLK